MPLTTSLYTGLTGMKTNSQMLDVVGNNISNVNTTGYKRSRATFETQISATLKNGSGPSAELGGTNPAQVGLGVRLASITRDFSGGGLQPTGVSTHMAVEGNGFFVVNQGGAQRYTRDGTFTLDRDFNLVTSSGSKVQGYGVDDDYNVVEGLLQDVNIPVGVLTIAEATENVNIAGNLNAGGDAATLGSIIESAAMFSDAAATTPATTATTLDSLFDASGTALFTTGDVITLTNASRGGANLADSTFEVGPANTTNSDSFGTTLGDFTAFMQDIFGIDTTQPGTPGVTVNAGGSIVVESNLGTANAIDIDPGDIVVNQSTTPTTPLTWSETQAADGESVRTTFIAYDSLGNPLEIDLTVVLESKDSSGTQWRFYTHSDDDTDLNNLLGTGELNFDTDGQFISASGDSLTIDRLATGALNPQTINLNFTDQFGAVSALTDVRSQVSSISQDGSPIGTLEGFSVSEDGLIVGVFSNSLLRNLGRIPLAMFSNNEGLLETGGNTYANTSNSGTPQITNPGASGSGRVVGRAIELSNVDLAEEFINLISAQTGFSANSRVITTSDQMIQELLSTIR